MSRAVALGGLVLALWASAAGAREPEPAPGVRVSLDREEVAPGEPFELVLERTWPEGLAVEPVDEAAWAPIALVRQDQAVRVEAGRVVERTRFRAQAFALGRLRVPVPPLRAAGAAPGTPALARAAPLWLQVRSALAPAEVAAADVEAPLALEVAAAPEALPDAGGGGARWLLLAAGLLAAGALGLGMARRRAAGSAPTPSPAAPANAEDAPARLAALGARLAAEPAAAAEVLVLGADVARRWIERRLGVPAPRLTTGETGRALAAASDRAPPDLAADLRALLAAADAVKFAAAPAGAGGVARVLERAARRMAAVGEGGP